MAKALIDFTGYPDGVKTAFKAGENVPDDYAKTIADKKPPVVSIAKSEKSKQVSPDK